MTNETKDTNEANEANESQSRSESQSESRLESHYQTIDKYDEECARADDRYERQIETAEFAADYEREESLLRSKDTKG